MTNRGAPLLGHLGLVLQDFLNLLQDVRREFVQHVETLQVVLELLNLGCTEDAVADVAAVSHSPCKGEVCDLDDGKSA